MEASGRRHQELLLSALRVEGEAQRALLAGDQDAAARFREAAELYRQSWEHAPARAFGRLVGMLKAAIIAGDAAAAVSYARAELGDEGDSPSSCYAIAIAALAEGDDERADCEADGMTGGSEQFDRTAAALRALARRDSDAYRAALEAIVADFESRDSHLTGVAIADTALMLERLAEPRGMAVGLDSPLLPAA